MTGMSQVLVGGAVALALADADIVSVLILLVLAGAIEIAAFIAAGTAPDGGR